MNNSTVKTIISVVVFIILLMIAVSFIKFAIKVLLPIAIIIIAGYIVYMLIARRW